MPIYSYVCPDCERKLEHEFVHNKNEKIICVQCHAVMKRLFPVNSRFAPKVFPADGIFLEHVSSEGHLFHSKGEMKEYEKNHDIEIGMLH